MIELTLNIDKSAVLAEVAKTTSYIGAKMDDENAYDRIFTTDEDAQMLDRFFDECKDVFSSMAKRLIVGEASDGNGNFSFKLQMSDSYQEAQTESIQSSLFSFFVTGIISKWNSFTNKEETAGYGTEAQANLDIVMRKLFYKKPPIRPTF